MTAMAALKAAVETVGYELELAKVTGATPTFEEADTGAIKDRIIELHEVYFELLLNKVPGDVPAVLPGTTVASESQPAASQSATPGPVGSSSGSGGLGGSGGLLITFGRYNGKTIAAIDGQDPGYVRWLADKAQDAEVQRSARAYLDAKYAAAEEEDPFAA